MADVDGDREDVRRSFARVDDEDGGSVLREHQVRLAWTEGRAGGFWTAALGRYDLTLLRLAPGFESAFHAMDLPAWVFVLEGAVEVEVSSGIRKRFMPGAVIRFDDVLGCGHRLRGSSGSAALIAIAREQIP